MMTMMMNNSVNITDIRRDGKIQQARKLNEVICVGVKLSHVKWKEREGEYRQTETNRKTVRQRDGIDFCLR